LDILWSYKIQKYVFGVNCILSGRNARKQFRTGEMAKNFNAEGTKIFAKRAIKDRGHRGNLIAFDSAGFIE
jgi:hypothetical protein